MRRRLFLAALLVLPFVAAACTSVTAPRNDDTSSELCRGTYGSSTGRQCDGG